MISEVSMDIAILFLITAIAGIGSKAFTKLCSHIVAQNSAAKFSLVLAVNGIVACLFFFCSGGFHIAVNGPTLLFSLVFALIVGVAMLSNVIVYRYANISGVNVLSSTLNVFSTAVIGWTLFSEAFGIKGLLRITVVLIAAAIELVNQIKKGGQKNDGQEKKALLPLILSVLMISMAGSASTVTVKLFSMSESMSDKNSFFFLTNALLTVGAMLVFLLSVIGKKEKLRGALSLLSLKKLISIAGSTVCSNVSSLISVLLLSKMAVSVYSPINFIIGILGGLVGSLLFKEKLGALSYVAAAVACVAMFV